MVLEKTLESPLDSKEIKPANSKGIQHWIFFGRTDVEAPILWPTDAKRPWKRPWCWKRLKAGGEGGGRRGDGSMDMSLNKLWEMLKDRGAQHATVRGIAESWTWLSDWSTTNYSKFSNSLAMVTVWLKWDVRQGRWIMMLWIRSLKVAVCLPPWVSRHVTLHNLVYLAGATDSRAAIFKLRLGVVESLTYWPTVSISVEDSPSTAAALEGIRTFRSHA